MPKFTVDVKAFISIEVEAENAGAARQFADDYVETSCSPSDMEAEAWNDVKREEEGATAKITYAGCFVVDGLSDVEETEHG